MTAIREVIGDDLTVSVSQLKAFMKCPRLFDLHYVRGVAPEFIGRPKPAGLRSLHTVDLPERVAA